jgi:hypothetical protein
MRRLAADELGAEQNQEEQRIPGPQVLPASVETEAAERVQQLAQTEQKGATMRASKAIQKVPIGGEDVRRWLVFTSFWGSVFYVLSCTSLIIGARRQTVKFHAPSVGIGYGLHVLTFVVGGSLLSAANSIVRGKSTSEQAEDAIGSGQIERQWPLQALGGAAGSVIPFALAVTSQKVASNITGRAAITEDVNWPAASGAMVVASGLTALAVARIAAWVARDAQQGS